MRGFEERKHIADESLHPTERFLDAYIEGNLRTPQSALGIVVMLGNALVSEADPDPIGLARSLLSSEQLQKLKMVMNRAHLSHDIPVRAARGSESVDTSAPSGRVVHDERMNALWTNSKLNALLLLATITGSEWRKITGVLHHESKETSEDLITEDVLREISAIGLKLRDPVILRAARATLSSFASSLRSEEGQRIAKELRSQVGYKQHGPPQSDLGKFGRELAASSYLDALNAKMLGDTNAQNIPVNENTTRCLKTL